MKSLIVYYSYSGTTKTVAHLLKGLMAEKGAVEIIEIKALDESTNFFKQGHRAFSDVKARIEDMQFDVSGYDCVCIGTPVWAFGPTPAVKTYLERCSGITGKEVILFCTSGGSGMDRCLRLMQEALARKGVTNFRKLCFRQAHVKDRAYVLSTIKESI
ncbi:MAG: NAD(P)H-dependent oxidoreductase [Candidatus Omnitrophica bacterium]|nr:NAD(P)H-dependent oxidoreductase [Candidatus Omnitrophota bacterium]